MFDGNAAAFDKKSFRQLGDANEQTGAILGSQVVASGDSVRAEYPAAHSQAAGGIRASRRAACWRAASSVAPRRLEATANHGRHRSAGYPAGGVGGQLSAFPVVAAAARILAAHYGGMCLFPWRAVSQAWNQRPINSLLSNGGCVVFRVDGCCRTDNPAPIKRGLPSCRVATFI